MGLRIESKIVRGHKGADPHTGAISFPIYQTATFKHPGLGQSTGYDYTRSGNPTREEVEKTIADLEGGLAGFAFSSGMAAIATLCEIFSPGDHLLVSDDLYGGTYRLFEEISRKHGLDFTYLDTGITENVINAIRANTRAVFIETPSNPMMKVTDIKSVVEIARVHQMLTIVDNTFLTPYLQRPLQLGADIVVHSATKYLGGHNDTLAGFVIVKDQVLEERLRFYQNAIGGVLAPFDSWLILRGLKTLAVRMERQEQNARIIANWLKDHPRVDKVYYVGLSDHQGHAVCREQASGFGAMISFSVRDPALAEAILGRVKLIAFAESLGGVESLITYPITQTHASIPKEILDHLGVDEKLLRLSVGIEAVEDIIDDLKQALA